MIEKRDKISSPRPSRGFFICARKARCLAAGFGATEPLYYLGAGEQARAVGRGRV